MSESTSERIDRVRERRLAEFVDRSAEIERYLTLVETGDPAVMQVSAESGMGKTSLLMRMVHECSLRKLLRVEVAWSDTRVLDYLQVLRVLRDGLGAEHFSAFTDLVNFYTDPAYDRPQVDINLKLQGGSIQVASGARISGSEVGDVAGVVLRDNMFVLQRTDLAVPVEDRRAQLTGRFLDGLRAVSASRRVVLFFDATEKMSELTHAWLWEQLLQPVIQGSLPNVRVVLLGQRPPPEDRDAREFTACVSLRPLAAADIAQYLVKRAVRAGITLPEALVPEMARLMAVATAGVPFKVADLADRYLQDLAR